MVSNLTSLCKEVDLGGSGGVAARLRGVLDGDLVETLLDMDFTYWTFSLNKKIIASNDFDDKLSPPRTECTIKNALPVTSRYSETHIKFQKRKLANKGEL